MMYAFLRRQAYWVATNQPDTDEFSCLLTFSLAIYEVTRKAQEC